METPPLDLNQAHRHFSAACFNKAWDYLDMPSRSAQEDQEMLLAAQASLWHWSQRADATPRHWSIGTWQISRIYSVLRDARNARTFAQLSMSHAPDAFCQGYGAEALARAESIASNTDECRAALQMAREFAELITDPADRAALISDLATIQN